MSAPLAFCPCHSSLSYDGCCRPYHEGAAAPTALSLMRSRYSAYAMGYADFIVRTASPPPRGAVGWRRRVAAVTRFCQATVFEGLEILDSTHEGDAATVTFKAILSQGGHDASFSEKSRFVRRGGRWLYVEP